MDLGYEKEPFETLKIKSSVAKKFRSFCKTMSCSQSMTLLLMLAFFEKNEISPKEDIGPSMRTLANLIKKRNNAVIAIMRAIEKSQTKPTTAMLQSLFEETETSKKNLVLEKKYFDDNGVSRTDKKE